MATRTKTAPRGWIDLGRGAMVRVWRIAAIHPQPTAEDYEHLFIKNPGGVSKVRCVLVLDEPAILMPCYITIDTLRKRITEAESEDLDHDKANFSEVLTTPAPTTIDLTQVKDIVRRFLDG